MSDVKRCTKCDIFLPVESFGCHRSRKDGLSNWCRGCVNKTGKLRGHRVNRKTDKQKLIDRNASLRKRYGINQEDYLAILEQQGGCCAICKSKSRLVVDHCHKSGRVRGVLCDRCNVAIGKSDEDISRLRAMILYLENPPVPLNFHTLNQFLS